MAKRTFIDPTTDILYRKGTTTVSEYQNWRSEHEGESLCTRRENVNNPAWINSHAANTDINQAKSTCEQCPLQAGCEFFANTKIFEGFDGVMGAQLFEDELV